MLPPSLTITPPPTPPPLSGDVSTKVALVTDEMVYNPLKKFDMMPQIVVGTPFALESALSKVMTMTHLLLLLCYIYPYPSFHPPLCPRISTHQGNDNDC